MCTAIAIFNHVSSEDFLSYYRFLSLPVRQNALKFIKYVWIIHISNFLTKRLASENVFTKYNISHSLTQDNKGTIFHIRTIKYWLIFSPTINFHSLFNILIITYILYNYNFIAYILKHLKYLYIFNTIYTYLIFYTHMHTYTVNLNSGLYVIVEFTHTLTHKSLFWPWILFHCFQLLCHCHSEDTVASYSPFLLYLAPIHPPNIYAPCLQNKNPKSLV